MRSLMLSAIAVLALGQNVAAGERSTLGQNVAAGERSTLGQNVAAGERSTLGQNIAAGERSTLGQNIAAGERSALDRVAFAVDGAESSHGHDNAMWRADPTGPQGPMQVSAAAAADIGGGDRFDADQNRAIGRAYLHQLFSRYRNWPDAIAAYNWGIGNLNAWVEAGRPPSKLVDGVEAYIGRVLHDSGLCTDAAAPLAPRNLGPRNPGPRNPGPRNPACKKMQQRMRWLPPNAQNSQPWARPRENSA